MVTLVQQLKRHEAVRAKLYDDATGRSLTLGERLLGKLTGGVGRNFSDRPLSPDEIDYLLTNDIKQATHDAKVFFPPFDTLSDIRQRVLIDMAFNLGLTRLSKFVTFKAALLQEDWEGAAAAMLNSKWAKQVGDEEGQRAHTLAHMMVHDSYPQEWKRDIRDRKRK